MRQNEIAKCAFVISFLIVFPLLLTGGSPVSEISQPEREIVWSFPGALETSGVFRGVVVAELPPDAPGCQGQEPPCYGPLEPDTKIVIRWHGVVLSEEDAARGYSERIVEPERDGSFTSIAPPATGNYHCECFVETYEPSDRGKGDHGVRVVRSRATMIHAEIMPRPRGAKPGHGRKVMRGPRALPRNAVGVFRGTGMDEVARVRMKDLESGRMVEGPRVGAQSYYEIQTLRHEMPYGRYEPQFEDQDGEAIEAPDLDPVIVPRLALTGTDVLRVRQRGHLLVEVNYQGGQIAGGLLDISTEDDEIIALVDQRVPVPAQGGTVKAPFTALKTGNFTILTRLKVPGDPSQTITDPDTPPDSLARTEEVFLTDDGDLIPVNEDDPIVTEHPGDSLCWRCNPILRSVYRDGNTLITLRRTHRITNDLGDPVARTPCEMVQITENQAVIYTAVTDENGVVPPTTIVMKGELSTEEIVEIATSTVTHITQVTDHEWSPTKESAEGPWEDAQEIADGEPCFCIAALEVEILSDRMRLTGYREDDKVAEGGDKRLLRHGKRYWFFGERDAIRPSDDDSHLIEDMMLACIHRLYLQFEELDPNSVEPKWRPVMLTQHVFTCEDFPEAFIVPKVRKRTVIPHRRIPELPTPLVVSEVLPHQYAADPTATRPRPREIFRITKVIKRPCPIHRPSQPRPRFNPLGPW